jgi:hypothetical protein
MTCLLPKDPKDKKCIYNYDINSVLEKKIKIFWVYIFNFIKEIL